MEQLITEYMNKTNKYWMLKPKSLFHNTISLLTSQKIKFSESRAIRKKLYELNENKDEYCPNIFSNLTSTNFKNCGLADNIIESMFKVIKLEKNNALTITNLEEIKGIGPWTIKSLKIMNNLDDNIFLYEDYWIRQRVSELLKSEKILSQANCKKLFSNSQHLSDISRFLWRINSNGTIKMLNGEELIKNDFI